MFEWHPDRSSATKEKASEMTAKIVKAYKIIMAYLDDYQFSFLVDDIAKKKLDIYDEEWWVNKFGEDSTWGVRNKQ